MDGTRTTGCRLTDSAQVSYERKDAMNVTEALGARASIRAYKPDPVSMPTLEGILAAALRTPSWANSQPWEVFVAIGEPLERLRSAFLARTREGVPGAPELSTPKEWPTELSQRTLQMIEARARHQGVAPHDPAGQQASLENNRRFFGAPVVVYLCLDRSLSPWSIYDLGALSQSLMLAAQEHGVDSTPAVNLVMYPDLIRAEMRIPDALLILIGIALGYRDPDDSRNSYRTTRRSLEDVVRFSGA